MSFQVSHVVQLFSIKLKKKKIFACRGEFGGLNVVSPVNFFVKQVEVKLELSVLTANKPV